jgi:hypothetical protein
LGLSSSPTRCRALLELWRRAGRHDQDA